MTKLFFAVLVAFALTGCAPTTTQSDKTIATDGTETNTTSATWSWSKDKGVVPPKQPIDPGYNPNVPPIQQP